MSAIRILLVDNRDSFTWNLAHDLGRFGAEVEVRQAPLWTPEDAEGFDGIVLSPGPGLPRESEGLMSLVRAWAPQHPMLGVCLGLQALVEWSGGRLRQMDEVLHGRTSTAVRTAEDPLLGAVPHRFEVGHYHSWVVDEANLPNALHVNARNDAGLVMAVSHKSLPVSGVQFHPESLATDSGIMVLKNFLKYC